MIDPMTILELAARVKVTPQTVANHVKQQTFRLDLAKRKRCKGQQFVIFEGPRLEAYIAYMDARTRAKQLKEAQP